MDKSVYNMKAEKIQRAVKSGDYATAAKICDTIDWTEVSSVRMLSMVADVYEHVQKYDTAIDILLMAYEEAPVGKRLLYKLTELALASHNIREAEDYYRSYLKEATDDNNRYILRYKIAEEKGEALDKKITILEAYRRHEFDEEWAYRLAELYDKAGNTQKCVALCDEIILWFGIGTYVDKAMALKEKYQPLTEAQMEHRANRAMYEDNLQKVQVEMNAATPEVHSYSQYINKNDIPQVAISDTTAEPYVSLDQSAFLPEDQEPQPEEDYNQSTRRVSDKEDLSRTRVYRKVPGGNPEFAGAYYPDKTEMPVREEEPGVTPRSGDTIMIPTQLEFNWSETEDETAAAAHDFIFIAAEDPEEAVKASVAALKEAHAAEGTPRAQVARISGSKLNAKGLLNSLPALEGKDLIVLAAGAVDDMQLDELKLARVREAVDKFFVLADSPDGIAAIKERLSADPLPSELADEEGVEPVVIPAEEPEAEEPEAAEPETAEETAPTAEEPAEEAPAEEPAVEEPEAAEEEPEAADEEPAVEEPEAEDEIPAEEPVADETIIYEELPAGVEEVAIDETPFDDEEAVMPAPAADDEEQELIRQFDEAAAALKSNNPASDYTGEIPVIPIFHEETGEYEADIEPELELTGEIPAGDDIPEFEPDEDVVPAITPIDDFSGFLEPEKPEIAEEGFEEPLPEIRLDGEEEPEAEEPAPEEEEAPEEPAAGGLTPEEFIAEMKDYASRIDCVLDKGAEESILLLTEDLQEEGETLSRSLAHELVEEAADEAESHSLVNMFHSRYDKDGCLILRAKHFI